MSSSAAALAVLLATAPLAFLLAHHLPLALARRTGRRAGITHLGAKAARALPRLRELVIEVERVVTTGHLVVVHVAPIEERHKNDLRWFAGALAHGSTDPVARAIARLSGLGRPIDVRRGPAHELRGAVDRHPVRIGVNGSSADGAPAVGTTVRVDVDLRPMGHITVADEVRRTATHCLTALRTEGIEPVLVSPTLARPDLDRVAEQVGVARAHHDTDAATVAATLQPATTGILRALPDAGSETTLPGAAGEDTVVRCTDPSLDAALAAIQHLRAVRRARRIAQVCAALVVLATLPLAVIGLLTPTYAALVAVGCLLLVAAVAAVTVLLQTTQDADD